MKKFVAPIIQEISDLFGAGNNNCTSSGKGNNNNPCTRSGG